MTTANAQSPMIDPANARFSRRSPGLRNTRRNATADSRKLSRRPLTRLPLDGGDQEHVVGAVERGVGLLAPGHGVGLRRRQTLQLELTAVVELERLADA